MISCDRLKMTGPIWVEEFDVPAPGNPKKTPFLVPEVLLENQTWNSNNRARIIYDKLTGTLWYGDSSSSSLRTLNDIPAGNIFLFESDIQQPGYTLLTNFNDGVVYYTSGSGAGGEAGGSIKSGGTWSAPLHSHNGPSHSHTAPSHTHTLQNHTHTGAEHAHSTQDSTLSLAQLPSHTHPPAPGNSNFLMQISGGNVEGGGDIVRNATYTGTMNGGGGLHHNHGPTLGTIANSGGPNVNITGSSGVIPSSTEQQQAESNRAFINSNPLQWRPKGINYTRQQRN